MCCCVDNEFCLFAEIVYSGDESHLITGMDENLHQPNAAVENDKKIVFDYTKAPNFTSEVFKIEISKLPKFFGYGNLFLWMFFCAY